MLSSFRGVDEMFTDMEALVGEKCGSRKNRRCLYCGTGGHRELYLHILKNCEHRPFDLYHIRDVDEELARYFCRLVYCKNHDAAKKFELKNPFEPCFLCQPPREYTEVKAHMAKEHMSILACHPQGFKAAIEVFAAISHTERLKCEVDVYLPEKVSVHCLIFVWGSSLMLFCLAGSRVSEPVHQKCYPAI